MSAAPKPAVCEWFARCVRPASAVIPHPILGDVPVCAECAAWYERMESPAKEKS